MIKSLSILQFPKELKLLISIFVIVLSLGVTLGVIYVGYNTNYTPAGTQSYYAGDLVNPDFEIPESYPKSLEALLLTTHTHVTAFAIIFLIMGFLMYFTDTLNYHLKIFLMIEPLLSTIITFSSFFAIRYINPYFTYLTITSGILMYLSFYLVAFIILKESLSKAE